MEFQKASQVSKVYGISSRMLRYYEQVGLIESKRKDGYAYRVYDDNAVSRLRQVIVLRKLRIPIKQIVSILNNPEAAKAVEVFTQKISEIDEEITALSTVKSMLAHLIEEINKKSDMNLKFLVDESMYSVLSALSFSNIKENEGNFTMEELNKVNESLSKLKDSDIRIVYLPPMTVAAAYFSGEAEYGVGVEATGMIEKFVWTTGLLKVKPDARGMGFNCSRKDLKNEIGITPTAYEAWVSIPEDMEVEVPLIKKTFDGGLYAAHILRDWSFEDWNLLTEWVNASDKYEENIGQPYFEEVLNYYNQMQEGAKMEDTQLDLLLPIKKREN